jgi:hypothetical protein
LKLTLPEEITLLSLDDRTGQTICCYSTYALSAAVISELALTGRVVVQDDMVRVTGGAASGDELLDEAARNIQQSSGELSSLVRTPLAANQCRLVLERLVALGILDRIEKRALGLFRYRRYPAHDGAVEAELRARLRAAALGTQEPDARTRSLLGLASAAQLCHTFLSREETDRSSRRIKALAGSDPVGEALFVAIRDDDTAAAAAGITVAIT